MKIKIILLIIGFSFIPIMVISQPIQKKILSTCFDILTWEEDTIAFIDAFEKHLPSDFTMVSYPYSVLNKRNREDSIIQGYFIKIDTIIQMGENKLLCVVGIYNDLDENKQKFFLNDYSEVCANGRMGLYKISRIPKAIVSVSIGFDNQLIIHKELYWVTVNDCNDIQLVYNNRRKPFILLKELYRIYPSGEMQERHSLLETSYPFSQRFSFVSKEGEIKNGEIKKPYITRELYFVWRENPRPIYSDNEDIGLTEPLLLKVKVHTYMGIVFRQKYTFVFDGLEYKNEKIVLPPKLSIISKAYWQRKTYYYNKHLTKLIVKKRVD